MLGIELQSSMSFTREAGVLYCQHIFLVWYHIQMFSYVSLCTCVCVNFNSSFLNSQGIYVLLPLPYTSKLPPSEEEQKDCKSGRIRASTIKYCLLDNKSLRTLTFPMKYQGVKLMKS